LRKESKINERIIKTASTKEAVAPALKSGIDKVEKQF
jgi:hypothetical protein